MAAIYGRVLILLCIVFGAGQAEKHVRLARQAPASGWSEWSIWSACSRSCGGGVSYQERHCLSGDGTCVGPQRTYRSCQIQDCPEGAVDFRLEQCAAFNTVPYEGQLFSWVPYEGGPNPCELNCMPKGEHFYYPQAEKVVDGTRCRRDGLDVCVDGVCRSVGCDMMLDSHTEEDMCRDCGGDNSTCKLFEGRFTRRKIPEGYNDIHIIPIGATNGRIAEIRGSHNYLALRNADGVFYLNGDFRIELPRTFQAAGTSIKYQRKVGSTQQKPEVITFVGPLTEPLFIVILTQTKNHGIEYSYYVPNGVGPDKPDTYSWTYTPYSNCTKECGGGHQARKVTCTRSGDYETVPSYLCDPELKPRSNRSCNTNPCPPSWYVGEWSPCSQSCDEGSQVRQVYCQRVNQHGRPEPIEETYCLAVLGFKPPYQQDCTLQTCPHWEAGNWSECSVACGFGTETRRVQCVADLIEPDESCDADDKPIDEQDCNLGPCAGVEWMKTEWTRCTGVCGAGSRSRQMFCATQAGTVFPKDLCDMDDMPDMTRSCPLAGECGARWVATDWSQCSATCGGGVHSRLVFCGEISNGNAIVQVPDSDCNPRTKFQMEEMCNMELCFDDYVWFTGPWGKCTVPCGGGTRTRVLVCMKGETPQRQALCPSGNAPLASQPCNIGPCTPATTQKIQPVTSILQASSIKTSQEKVVTLKTVTTEKTSEVPSTTAPYTETTFSKISTVGATHIPTSSDKLLNDNGIACDESEFGCCQDGVTAASGPYKQGCRPCDESEFKCCPDGVTAAKGLNFAGCEDETDPEVVVEAEESVGCAETEFGCCGNQVDAATGPNFEGCDDTVQDACLLPMNPGICRAWIVKFFFNTHYGQCTQFWYGGCGGNDNLFDTYDECKNECIGVDEPLPQEDLCVLPMDVGPCKGSFDRFYYNSKTGQCESFKYGGCRGNENSFRSQDDCEIVCGNINADPCSLEADYGGCRGSDLRWYFNTDSSMCEEFEYSGCHGNQNRFPDKQSCEQRCNANVIDILPQVSPYDQCSMPADSGACSEALPQWAYDVRTGQCKEFVYNGCEGNYNRFETELSCQEACYVEGKTLCERMQALFRASGVEDQPECKLDGSYEPLQCPPRTGDCWCVTDLGEEIDGSRITRQSLTIRPDCARYPNSAGHRKVVIETTTPDMASLTLCQRHQRTAEGSYVPQCTASGEYETMQCFGTRMDYCWCVNATGEEIKFTRTLPGERKPHCEGIEDSVCFRAYRDVMSGLVDSEYMPQCSPQGLFSRLQCQTERGCLCVNETNGNVIFAVDVDPQLATPRSCDGVSTRVLTRCQAQRQEILISGGTGSGEDGFIPQCTEDGAYQDLQCHEGRASYCWCVNQDGEEIPRTRLRGGVPDCKQGVPTSSANTNSPGSTHSPASTESPAITNSPAIESPAITNSPAIESPALPTEGSTKQESTTIAKAQTTRATGPEETTTAEARAIEATTAITTTNVIIVESEATIIGGGDEIIADEEEDEDCTDSSNCQGGSSASINQSPSAIVARPGNMVILTCEATGVPTPTITWRRDGQDVSTLDDRFIASQDGTLTILDSKVSDSGPYVCVADNNVGDPDTATFEITVAERSRPQRPRGHRQLRIKTREGESVTMNCRARADPTPVITWDFQGLELSDIEPRITKRPGGSLQIDDVSVADIGTYKCTARNMYGIIQMRTFTLIVEADVQIVNPPTSTKAMEGETITLHCGTTGSPKPKIRWNVDTNPVPLTSRFVIGTNDQLTIRDIKRSDAGEYSCSAANGISSKTAYATVAVAGDNEDDPNCQDQPKYMACQLIVFANLCQTHPYYKYCCRTCRDNGMLPTTTAAP